MAEDEKAENMKLIEEYGEGNDAYTVNDIETTKELIRRLKEENIQVILEPFLWINSGSIGETELAPEDINAWFWSWKEDILKTIIKELAIPYDVEYLVVGTNFENLESCEGYWSDVFRDVKEKYGYEGKVIYRTNWWTTAPEWEKLGGEAEKEAKKSWEKYEKKLNNSLFSDKNLDIISISAYFELTNEKNPTIETLKDSILSTKVHNRGQNVYEEVENFANKHGKKIFFGELGTIDRDYYALYPWNPGVGGNYNEDAHYNYFKAYTDLFWNEEWFVGFSIFALGDENSYYNISEKRAISFIYNLK